MKLTRRFTLLLGLTALMAAGVLRAGEPAQAEGTRLVPYLPDAYLTSGAITRRAFATVSASARHSVAQLAVDGKNVALATIVEPTGLLVSKASELPSGKLTAKLSDGRTLEAHIVGTDEENDVALLRIDAKNLKPVRWLDEKVSVGQWVATQGLEAMPDAMGIVSGAERKIVRARALIGVTLDPTDPKVVEVSPGLGAARAGLKPDDVILAVEGKAVTTSEELRTELLQFRGGQVAGLRVRRGEQQLDLKVEMTSSEASEARSVTSAGRRADLMNRMGSGVSRRAEEFELAIQHDTVLEPSQCGGPLLDLSGRAVGVNIARAGRVATYALPASLVRSIIDEILKRSAEATATP